MCGIYEIDKTLQPEATKEEKIKEIDYLFTLPEDERAESLIGIVESYYTQLAITMPYELYLGDLLNDLIYPKNKMLVKKCLSSMKKYALEYHEKTTEKITIPNEVTKKTLLKIINKTWYGGRLDEIGIKGSLTSNIKKGFIPRPALVIIINKVLGRETPETSVLKAFENKNKINFINDKLKALL